MHPALAARRRRITALRQRVAAAALATFVLFWGVVAWNGSMGATTTTAQTTTVTEQSTTTTEGSTTTDEPVTTDDDSSTLSTGQS